VGLFQLDSDLGVDRGSVSTERGSGDDVARAVGGRSACQGRFADHRRGLAAVSDCVRCTVTGLVPSHEHMIDFMLFSSIPALIGALENGRGRDS
jgi:hypothetical protein